MRRELLGMTPLQWLLSVFVVYHLWAVLLTPMLLPPFGERLGAWVRPYAATFEFTNLWEFFAPNPAVPMLLSWEAIDAQGNAVAHDVWPRQPGPGPIGDEQVRRMAALYFMMSSDSYIEKMMVPYLCGQDRRYHAVRIWKESHPVPSITEAAAGARIQADPAERKFVTYGICEGA
jgi:hypothetical protein